MYSSEGLDSTMTTSCQTSDSSTPILLPHPSQRKRQRTNLKLESYNYNQETQHLWISTNYFESKETVFQVTAWDKLCVIYRNIVQHKSKLSSSTTSLIQVKKLRPGLTDLATSNFWGWKKRIGRKINTQIAIAELWNGGKNNPFHSEKVLLL